MSTVIKDIKVNPMMSIELLPSGKAEFKFQTLPLPEAIRLSLMAIETACKQYIALAEREGKDEKFIEAMRSDMHEMINVGASSLLDRLFPDIEMRPDITVAAILEAENKIIQEQPEKVEAAQKAYLESTDYDKDMALLKKNTDTLKAQEVDQKKKQLKISDHKKSSKK